MQPDREPMIIQGGMGVAVSAWQLARAVSLAGQLGVVSGTAIDVVLTRRLQLGDPGGHIRRALADFPFPAMATRILDRYFIPGGKASHEPFLPCRIVSVKPTKEQLELVVVANFVEVHLAKEDHEGLVGINYLEKIQPPTLPSLYGAMLAGVDYVLMGAGIPRSIPGAIDQLVNGDTAELPLTVAGSGGQDRFVTSFDPRTFTDGEMPWLERPKFLAIVASATLASMLARKANGRVDGFVVEGPTAGGHNAPPRGKMELNPRGEPVYGDRDKVDLAAIRSLGRPFWLAGSYGSPRKLAEALQAGASGVQIGTAFAFCNESGLSSDIKRRVLHMIRAGVAQVITDPAASPAGFPFKVFALEGSLSDEQAYQRRQRGCDLGFLRQAYRKTDGTIGWRCPADSIPSYVRSGGEPSESVGRKCLCNGLMANVGLAQVRKNGEREAPLVTCGDDLQSIVSITSSCDSDGYSAKHVIDHMLSFVQTAACSG